MKAFFIYMHSCDPKSRLFRKFINKIYVQIQAKNKKIKGFTLIKPLLSVDVPIFLGQLTYIVPNFSNSSLLPCRFFFPRDFEFLLKSQVTHFEKHCSSVWTCFSCQNIIKLQKTSGKGKFNLITEQFGQDKKRKNIKIYDIVIGLRNEKALKKEMQ